MFLLLPLSFAAALIALLVVVSNRHPPAPGSSWEHSVKSPNRTATATPHSLQRAPERVLIGLSETIQNNDVSELGLEILVPFGGRKEELSELSSPELEISEPLRAANDGSSFGQHFSYAGIPLTNSAHPCTPINLLENEGFLVGYCEGRGAPAWVSYRLIEPSVELVSSRPSFVQDYRTSSVVMPAVYRGSGYDRGHLAPNLAIANRYGARAQFQTFLMSNIAPQKPGLNRGAWHSLERRIDSSWADLFGEVWIVTGPIYDENVKMLSPGVEIPDAFYKIVLDEVEQEGEKKLRALAFVIEQDVSRQSSLETFLVSIDHVEKLTGMDFFSALPDDIEGRLESTALRKLW